MAWPLCGIKSRSGRVFLLDVIVDRVAKYIYKMLYGKTLVLWRFCMQRGPLWSLRQTGKLVSLPQKEAIGEPQRPYGFSKTQKFASFRMLFSGKKVALGEQRGPPGSATGRPSDCNGAVVGM